MGGLCLSTVLLQPPRLVDPLTFPLRDKRALISVMTFAFARIGAVVAMRGEDCYPKGKHWWVRLHEKGGKRHEMPAHHTLDAYLEAAGLRDGGKAPRFARPPAVRGR
jgi:hypothetical protein